MHEDNRRQIGINCNYFRLESRAATYSKIITHTHTQRRLLFVSSVLNAIFSLVVSC